MCSGRLGPFILAQLNPPGGGGGIYLLGAALALYAASRLAAVALAGHDPRRAGWRAVGHFLPIAAVALASVLLGHSELAIGVAIGTSVASLSLALGTVVYLAPPARLPATRRAWMFVLPAALLALLAGFTATLTWLHAALLAALGVSVLGLWREQAESIEMLMESASADPAHDRPTPHVSPLHLALAVVLAVVGGWVAARGAQRVSASSPLLSTGLLAAAVLSPLLVLPALGTGAELAQRDQTGSMAGTLVALALLNVCGLLPAVALAGYVVPGARQFWFPAPPAPAGAASEVESSPTSLPATSPAVTTEPTTGPAGMQPATAPATHPMFRRVVRPTAPPTLWNTIRERAGPTRYPLPVWRVDTVILIVLGLALVPFALGRLTLGRTEGMVLLLGYAAYLTATALMAKKLL